MEVVTPTFANFSMVKRNEIHHVGQLALGKPASVIGEKAATRPRKPNLGRTRRRTTFGNMNMNRLAILGRPKKDCKTLKQI